MPNQTECPHGCRYHCKRVNLGAPVIKAAPALKEAILEEYADCVHPEIPLDDPENGIIPGSLSTEQPEIPT